MYLAPDENETQIADAANRILADLTPLSRLHHGGSPELSAATRQAVAEGGWFALSLPEASGGAEMSEVEFALFFREAGRQCASVDVLAQSLAVLLVKDQPEIRDALISGERAVSLIVTDSESVRLLGGNGDWALHVDPHSARLLNTKDSTGQTLSSLDPAVSMWRLEGDQPAAVVESSGSELWRLGQLGIAAMLVGIGETALSALVEYAKLRETFGKPIGANQAVRHPCADIATRLEAARCQLWFAAAAMKEGRSDSQGHLDAAKHLANEAAAFATDINIQLHGGIGVTDEHDAHILMKHALLLRKLFGSKRYLLSQLLNARLET